MFGMPLQSHEVGQNNDMLFRAMSRDQVEYGPDVEAFNPERFLDSEAMDPAQYVFGFGRR